MTSIRRFAAVGLTVVVAIAVLMAFPSVRAAASDFLGLFRVQQFAPISVSPQQLALLERLGEEGLEPGEFVVTQETVSYTHLDVYKRQRSSSRGTSTPTSAAGTKPK